MCALILSHVYRQVSKGLAKGYMGHITQFANAIVIVAKSEPVVAQMIKQTPGWEEYVRTSLAISNRLANSQIGGPNPLGTVIFVFLHCRQCARFD